MRQESAPSAQDVRNEVDPIVDYDCACCGGRVANPLDMYCPDCERDMLEAASDWEPVHVEAVAR